VPLSGSGDSVGHSTEHQTEAEPGAVAHGTTIVTAVQQGRFSDGGASDIGWATSPDSGLTWTHGSLPGVTTYVGGTYDRASDPTVAYDAFHGTWLIVSLGLIGAVGAAIQVSPSTDGGLTWQPPVTVSTSGGDYYDKDWITCDNTAASPFYGHCYVEWDDNSLGNLIRMSTSADGGQTWSAPHSTDNNATGIGGQPAVQPSGKVIVPIDNANETAVLSFSSLDGGASWTSTTKVSTIKKHTVAGGMRSDPLISATIDTSGKVYVVWQDCRFRSLCRSNDLVLTTSVDGATWSAVTRIPIDPTNSAVDHFVPGLTVDPSTSGATAHLGLDYYDYSSAHCSAATCQLNVGYISSTNGGTSWSVATKLAGPISLSWIASTTQGPMVGDYIATAVSAGKMFPFFANAATPAGSTYREALDTAVSGLALKSGDLVASADGVQSVTGDAPAGMAAATAQ
jgi:BNR repeat-like domain